jgi:hypothetical protein
MCFFFNLFKLLNQQRSNNKTELGREGQTDITHNRLQDTCHNNNNNNLLFFNLFKLLNQQRSNQD